MLMLGEAFATVDWAVALGYEGNGGRLSAGGANGFKLFSGGGSTVGLAGDAALLTTGRFILEAFFRIEFLLTRGKHEFCAAIAAGKGLVFVHNWGFLRFLFRNGKWACAGCPIACG